MEMLRKKGSEERQLVDESSEVSSYGGIENPQADLNGSKSGIIEENLPEEVERKEEVLHEEEVQDCFSALCTKEGRDCGHSYHSTMIFWLMTIMLVFFLGGGGKTLASFRPVTFPCHLPVYAETEEFVRQMTYSELMQ